MATVNFYLDKADKKNLSPIYLRINCNNRQIKVSVGQKVSKEDFDKDKQLVKKCNKNFEKINYYLGYLRLRVNDLFDNSQKKKYTDTEIKKFLQDIIKNYKDDKNLSIVEPSFKQGVETPVTFVDLFAGAGGFSEGFLQAGYKSKFFDFVLANDINSNCELTHVVRYNHQLGLPTGFLCQDVTEPDFIDNLLGKIGDKKIDVVCGGPPCQSFSLAGKRKKFDKKDDLFSRYLDVIKILQPKYFVMENVKGILTKENGKIKELVLKEINSIVDITEIPRLVNFVSKIEKENVDNKFLVSCVARKIDLEQYTEDKEEEAKTEYIKTIEARFRKITPKIVDYKTSKTDTKINTIRHGFNMLVRKKEWEKLQRDIIKEKDFCNISNDYFEETYVNFLTEISSSSVIDKIEEAFKELKIPRSYRKDCDDIVQALRIYNYSLDESLSFLSTLCNKEQKAGLRERIKEIRLYRIEKPFVANASDYGVPQNRERVLFIGCRKDQQFIETIPPTVEEDQKVSVFEALYDLDFVSNNQEAHSYSPVNLKAMYNGESAKMKKLLRKRAVDGRPVKKAGKTYADWSKEGRLNKKYSSVINTPFYVRNEEDLDLGKKNFDLLHNHKTSNQGKDVVDRLRVIIEEGNYKKAQDKLNKRGLASNKRNYNLLVPGSQSPTILTIPDDYVHYKEPRSLTVREMARLQSFDDSFVFQGKRSTGGNNRKTEVPQYTLVGNSVPPLMARAIGVEILKHIE
ncbi:DNA cytosine methyltransferase [Zunongwangia sp. HRR-M8]|uniref:DNA cytosine methyltransferase n=1 Tax=Zunongwangia sp. HRR-M8 TaxID=3015170 RepID=UPI0022DDCE90|nr:DNA cytosine methyltransferase [Zunongwangia sp. HRR-M8]WBL22315.1 DNA cytosine methyltransferase [Zunongwangia sp. HRR-M8]